jgi:hypothetical protein
MKKPYEIDWNQNNVVITTKTLRDQLMVGAFNSNTNQIQMLMEDGFIIRDGSAYKVEKIREFMRTIGTNFLPVI